MINLDYFKNNIKFSRGEIEKELNQPRGFLTFVDNGVEQKFMFYIYPIPENEQIDLTRKYISLGDENYYKYLNEILPNDSRDSWYKSIGDIAYKPELIDDFRRLLECDTDSLKPEERELIASGDILKDTFFQFITEVTVRGRLHRLSHGKEQYLKYNLSISSKSERLLEIKVNQESILPNNIYAIIGKNGTGKTSFLKQLAYVFLENDESVQGRLKNKCELTLSQESLHTVNNLLYISYSPFDKVDYDILGSYNSRYIGLRNRFVSTSYFALKENFENFLFEQLENKVCTDEFLDFCNCKLSQKFDLVGLKYKLFDAQALNFVMESRYIPTDEDAVIWEFITELDITQQYQLYKTIIEYNRENQEAEEIKFHQKHINQLFHDLRHSEHFYNIFMARCAEKKDNFEIIKTLEYYFENEDCRVRGSENSVLEWIESNYDKLIDSEIEKTIFEVIYGELSELLELQIAYLIKTLIDRNNMKRKYLLLSALDYFEEEGYLYQFKEYIISNPRYPSFDKFVSYAKELSSGQKIVLTSLMEISLFFDEQSMLLIDEPELFLHPSLLKSYIRALSKILKELNGFSILTTHNPLTIQEIPHSCVYEMCKEKNKYKLQRVEYRTFGENVSELMKNVYGVYLANTGYNQLISQFFIEGKFFDIDAKEKEEMLNLLGREALIKFNLLERKFLDEKTGVKQ
ncbi:AAA family ATPase [Streptococcus suis]|uniref:AAA family ATPase n=2 Tax=Streptococcus suis TaxID=1307 RepID=UPI00196191C6|nr:AAA family ATPase [Streptococcus suis]MBM7204070.1 AAA family ATPase [Streptococcus suis]